MRGIERFLAAVLLVGAVGGAAAFARYAGTEPEPPAFHFSASPPQHLTIPQTVVQIPLPKAGSVAVKPVVAARPRLRLVPTVPARPIVPTPVSPPEPTPAAPPSPSPPVQAPTPAPAPAPPVAAPAPPAPVAAPAAPVRAIAAVPAAAPTPAETPTAPKTKKHGHRAGKAKGHDKHQGVQGNEGDDDEGDDAVAPPAEQPCPASVDQTAPTPAAQPTESGPTGENGDSHGAGGQGNGNGNGNGHSHGHGG
jgi:hypothetical protein